MGIEGFVLRDERLAEANKAAGVCDGHPPYFSIGNHIPFSRKTFSV